MEFSDMGPAWVPVREAIHAGTLRAGDPGATEVAGRFDALIRYACLKLGRQLGIEVVPALSRKELADPAARTQALVTQLVTTGSLTGGVRIPAAVGPLLVTADLRARGAGHAELLPTPPRLRSLDEATPPAEAVAPSLASQDGPDQG